jgi:hypothetical protein
VAAWDQLVEEPKYALHVIIDYEPCLNAPDSPNSRPVSLPYISNKWCRFHVERGWNSSDGRIPNLPIRHMHHCEPRAITSSFCCALKKLAVTFVLAYQAQSFLFNIVKTASRACQSRKSLVQTKSWLGDAKEITATGERNEVVILD